MTNRTYEPPSGISEVRDQIRLLLPIDPDDGTIVVSFDSSGGTGWGSPETLIDGLTALVLAAEARGYRKAIEDLRAGDRYLAWYGEELGARAASGGRNFGYVPSGFRRQLAAYLESRLTSLAATPGEETRTDA